MIKIYRRVCVCVCALGLQKCMLFNMLVDCVCVFVFESVNVCMMQMYV